MPEQWVEISIEEPDSDGDILLRVEYHILGPVGPEVINNGVRYFQDQGEAVFAARALWRLHKEGQVIANGFNPVVKPAEPPYLSAVEGAMEVE